MDMFKIWGKNIQILLLIMKMLHLCIVIYHAQLIFKHQSLCYKQDTNNVIQIKKSVFDIKYVFFCSECWCGRPLGGSTRRCFSIRRFRFCLVQKKNVKQLKKFSMSIEYISTHWIYNVKFSFSLCCSTHFKMKIITNSYLLQRKKEFYHTFTWESRPRT